jgi:uncharacterized protein YcaQ
MVNLVLERARREDIALELEEIGLVNGPAADESADLASRRLELANRRNVEPVRVIDRAGRVADGEHAQAGLVQESGEQRAAVAEALNDGGLALERPAELLDRFLNDEEGAARGRLVSAE